MKHPFKPVAEINEAAKKIDITTIGATASAAKEMPSAVDIIAIIVAFKPILILLLKGVQFFTNDETDEKLDYLIAELEKL